MRPRARGRMSATPMCGQSGWPAVPSPTIATKPPVYGRISMSSGVLSTTSSTGRPGATSQFVGNTHSGWSLQAIPTGKPGHHVNPGGAQHGLVTDAGKHEQMRGFDRAGGQHDAIGGSGDRPARADGVHADRAAAGEAQSHCSGLGQQREIRSFQRGQQICGTRSRYAHRRRC